MTRIFGAALVCLLLLSPMLARAQVSLDRYIPAPTHRDGFAISRPDHPGHLRLGAQLQLDYANEPLVWETRVGDSDSVRIVPVRHQFAAHVLASIGLFDRLLVYVHIPTNLVMKGNGASSGLPADGASFGNLGIGARVRLLGEEDDLFSFGIQGKIGLPTSHWVDSANLYSGEDKPSGTFQALAEIRNQRARLTANLGAHFRDPKLVDTLGLGSELMAGVGGAYGVLQGDTGIDVLAEMYGSTVFNHFANRESSPVEALVGAKLNRIEGFGAGVAGTVGLSHGYGSPTYRLIATLAYLQPTERDLDGDGLIGKHDQCPEQPEDFDKFEDEDGCPDPDNDKDGIPDKSDRCPLEAEDLDGFEDEDGCPDPDNDKDGILDAQDACKDAAEDFDKFDDEDGCPDLDNDNDGVLDAADKCPTVAEDRDGFEDEDGCPDPDNDGDGILDSQDACPAEKEPFNGVDDEDGCPDKIRVDPTKGQIFILEPVQFAKNSATILSGSFELLREIARALEAHPEIKQLRIEGHTDSQGNDKKNLKLSQSRAESVMEFLRSEHIAPERMIAQGFGEVMPIADNNTAEGRALNRRVDFRL